MARLPTRDTALGTAPSLRSGRPIATYDVTAIGRGAQQLGKGIAQFGAGIANAASGNDDVKKFETEQAFQQFKWNEHQALNESMHQLEPDQAENFADRWAEGYKERAKGFFSGVPDKFKKTYDLKLFGAERQFYTSAATAGRSAQKQHALGQFDDIGETYLNRASAGEPLDAIRNDFGELIESNPYLSGVDKDREYRKRMSSVEKAHIEGRIQRGDSIDEIQNDLLELRQGFESGAEGGDAIPVQISETQKSQLKNVEAPVVERLGKLQSIFGREFSINSGYRSPEHNRKVGGASKSQHIHGNAIDIDVSDLSEEERVEVINEASKLGFTGIGVYKNSLHLDIGNRRAWGPSYGRGSVPEWADAAIDAHLSRNRVGGSGLPKMASISIRLETGSTDPLEGVSQIARDSGGTKSYGNFGLNSQSGGSIFAFTREYGGDLGLTAKPGTSAFDRQWTEAARNAPDELHAAELDWWNKNIAGGVSKNLVNAGIPDQVASDPRVIAYFADRSIQQGPASIDGVNKHKARIADAFKASGGDPEEFLKQVTELDRGALQSDFPTALRTGVYSPEGHDTRLDGRLQMALQMPTETSNSDLQYTGPYKYLDADDRIKLANKATIAARAVTLQQVDDAAAAIRQTGRAPALKGGEDVLERAERILTRNQFEKARIKLETAQIEHQAFSNLDMLPEAELDVRLAETEPQTGETLYSERVKVYDDLVRKVDEIRKVRDTDPAKAVEKHPKVQLAIGGVQENPGDPEFIQQLAAARLDAQAEIGIPPGLQSPITKSEARVLTAPVRGLEGKALYEGLTDLQAKVEDKYGPYARAVAIDAIEFVTRSEEIATEMTDIISGALRAQPVDASKVRALQIAQEEAMATQAFDAEATAAERMEFGAGDQQWLQQYGPLQDRGRPMPPQRAIEFLLQNPATASDFDAKYGPGAAALIFSQQGR